MFDVPAPGRRRQTRVLTIGDLRDALGTPADGLRAAISESAETTHIDASPSLTVAPRLLRTATAAARRGSCEAIHLYDARFALAALALRRRLGVPVVASITARDLDGRSPARRVHRALLARLDELITADERAVAAARARNLHVSVAPHAASGLPAPSARALASMASLLDDVAPGRLVVAVPWTRDVRDLRWFHDAVMPLLIGSPVVLLLGAPSRRQARILGGAIGSRSSFRAHVGAIDGDVLSAAARCADAFVVIGETRRVASGAAMLGALVASSVPLVAGAAVSSPLLAHERNVLAGEPRDAFGLVTTVNKLLALPAQQRHELGLDFTAYTLAHWPAEAAAAVYAERFAAITGRPQIPANLRAA